MVQVTDEHFEQLISRALESLPGEHARNISNVAILMADDPTPEQREQLQLGDGETLFGLYEGVPLAQRQGVEPLLPDRITIFKNPLCNHAEYESELLEEIRHTLWHEIGHYYGLDHNRIHELEQ